MVDTILLVAVRANAKAKFSFLTEKKRKQLTGKKSGSPYNTAQRLVSCHPRVVRCSGFRKFLVRNKWIKEEFHALSKYPLADALRHATLAHAHAPAYGFSVN